MKTAIYVRVSTDKQSHDSQLLELRAYGERRGWAEVVAYSDTITGSKFTRRGLDALFGEVRKGKVERVFVFRYRRSSCGYLNVRYWSPLLSLLNSGAVARIPTNSCWGCTAFPNHS